MTQLPHPPSAADHPDGVLRDLVPVPPLLHAPRRPGHPHRRRRRQGPGPRRPSSRSRSATGSTTRSTCSSRNYWERTHPLGPRRVLPDQPQRQRDARRPGRDQHPAGASGPSSSRSSSASASGCSPRSGATRSRTTHHDRHGGAPRRSPCSCSGFLLQYFFAVLPGPNYWNWPEWAQLRTSGIGPDTWALFFIPTGEQWRYLILPAITLASVSTALAARMTRGSMLEVMRADYMRTARAKGLRERDVVTRHGLRNAMLPVVTLIGIDFGTVIGAAVLTETVFSWPGLGSGHRRVGGAARPAGHPRAHPGGRDRVLRHQPPGRPVLRVVRPTDPSREGRRLVTTLDSATGPSTELEVTEPGGGIGDVADLAAARPLRKDVWRRFRRNKLAMVGLGILVLLVLVGDLRAADRALRPRASATRARSGSRRRWTTGSAPTRSASTCSAGWSTAPGSP